MQQEEQKGLGVLRVCFFFSFFGSLGFSHTPRSPVNLFFGCLCVWCAMSLEFDDCLLQEPWQPAVDDLSIDAYVSMETCKVKYNLYQEAIFRALGKLLVQQQRSSASALPASANILVVGCGRGPLVRASLLPVDTRPTPLSCKSLRSSGIVSRTSIVQNSRAAGHPIVSLCTETSTRLNPNRPCRLTLS